MMHFPRRPQEAFVVVELALIGLTALAGALAYLIPELTGHNHLYGLIEFFDLGLESNFPTYVASTNLLVGGALSALIYAAIKVTGERPSRYWLLLSAILAYLSLDEAARIHEQFGNLAPLLPGADILPERHSWLLAGAVVASVMGLSMVRFLRQLPRRLALSFAAGGAVLAIGSLGMEFVGSLMLLQGFTPDDFAYQVRRWLEETLEMCGVLIFNCAAARELARVASELRIVRVASDPHRDS